MVEFLWFYFLISTLLFNERILSPKSLTDGNPNSAWTCPVTKISTWQGRYCTVGWWQWQETCSPMIFVHRYTKTDSIFKNAPDSGLRNVPYTMAHRQKEWFNTNIASFHLSIFHAHLVSTMPILSDSTLTVLHGWFLTKITIPGFKISAQNMSRE